MKAIVNFFISVICATLSACSVQQPKQNEATATAAENTAISRQGLYEDKQNPPMAITKNGKILNLVRVMDGAVCKNDLEGAKGVFLVYANPQDIERIKREQGAKVFSEFETKIQSFSETILQQAINTTNLSEDPFSIGEDVAKQKMADQLSHNFRLAAADPITVFEKETTLAIDIDTYTPSLEFFQRGCEANLNGPESLLDDMPYTGSVNN